MTAQMISGFQVIGIISTRKLLSQLFVRVI